jgi:hypothetical protein
VYDSLMDVRRGHVARAEHEDILRAITPRALAHKEHIARVHAAKRSRESAYDDMQDMMICRLAHTFGHNIVVMFLPRTLNLCWGHVANGLPESFNFTYEVNGVTLTDQCNVHNRVSAIIPRPGYRAECDVYICVRDVYLEMAQEHMMWAEQNIH